MRSPRRAALAAALVVAALVAAALAGAGAPAHAAARCAPPVAVDDAVAAADVAFVGRAVALVGGHQATFQVHDVWKGLDAEEDRLVDVRSGIVDDAGEVVATPDAATFEEAARYLVVADRVDPAGDGPELLVSGACSATTPWAPSLDAHRPDGAMSLDLGEDVRAPGEATTGDGADEGTVDDEDDGFSPTARTWGLIILASATALFLLDRAGRALGNRKLRREG